MSTDAESRGLRSLPESECWRLLDSSALGRIALVVEGWPQVFPVNYSVGEGALVFRSGPGAKVSYGPGSRACFEIDGWDDRSGTGWSVMVLGVLRDITEATDDRAVELRQLPLHPAPPGIRHRVLALCPNRISGRRFGGPGMVRPLPFEAPPSAGP
jgi:uncharacterized protein